MLDEARPHFGKRIGEYIDEIVSDAFDAKELAKFMKKREKAMLTGIVVGVADAKEFGVYRLSGKQTIATVKAIKPLVLQDLIKRVTAQLGKNQVILNTNL